MIKLHFHKEEPVPCYVNNVYSIHRCRCKDCEKVLLVNRNTGFRKWTTIEKAFYQAQKSETGL